ncbi:amino acid adenylation domain-containing protein [Kibdelosporangium banguiense]|uniref:Amino acid adenylation domain-containing protein n=1 Tax=Kibdelosporangium banguiense TaxID=1365924 RepID=A0ABS4TVX9_9PSEU|nr:non-ribosomal peptide synthetase [Kibdelosporangium banguiense]MBP2328528.1 amino acid adenylation domain-containing protein [Kibdelosporangium banguiense]
MADVSQRIAPLSYQQERMYLFEGFDSSASANNLAFVHWIDGELDRPALNAAVAELHRRHEILRTRYPDGASQWVSTPDDYRLPFGDLSAGADPDSEVRRLLDKSVNHPFDLAAEAPVRWTLYALGPGRHALTLVLHHIAFDAWSKAIIDTELSALYQAFHSGAEPPPAQAATRYADYAIAQRGRTEQDLRADLDQWVQAMAGAPSTLRLPFDRPARADTGFTGHPHHAPIPAPLMHEVERLGGRARASAFMVLLAAFAGLLAKRGGQRDMVIGVPTAGRSELDLEPLIGCFVDTVPFRIRLAGLDTFADLLSHVRDVTLDTHDRPQVPLARLVAALRPDREPGREPLVQVVFQVNNAPAEALRLTGLTVTGQARTPTSTDVDLTLTVGDGHDGPSGQWQYKTELFDAGTIEDLRQDFQRILEQVVEDPTVPLADLLGAVDTVDLPPSVGEQAVDRTAPRTPTERLAAQIWAEILEVADAADIAAEDSFFDLGGHSLTAGQVVARIGELVPTLSTRGMLRDVLRYPVLAEFAAVLADRMSEAVITAGPATGAPAGRIPVISRQNPLPLSLGQKRLWFLDQFVADSTEYFVPMAVRVRGELDIPALTAALREIVDRHEVLRTSVVLRDDEPVGLVRPAETLTVELVDPDPALLATADGLTRVAAAEGFRPFDLEHGLPIRASLLCLGEHDHVLCLTVHHMVFDGWSSGIFFDELEILYGAFAAGLPSPLPPVRVQYADVAAFQEACQHGPEFAAKLDFWRAELDGATPFELSPDLPRPPRRTAPGALVQFTIDETVTGRLERMATRHGATLFMALLTAWQTLLYRHSGRTDLTLGTTAAERQVTESEQLIGLFINMLVLRGDLSGNPSFAELLARTRDRTIDAYANQDVPFDRLVAELVGERDLSRTPLFQVMIKLSNVRQRETVLPGLTIEPLPGPPIPAKYDIEIDFTRHETGTGGMTAVLRYDTGLYLPATIDRLIRHLTALLGAVTADPATPIDLLDLAGPDERATVRELTARRPVDVPDRRLHQLVEDQVARAPAAVAVVDDECELTYAELDAWANRIAVLLREHGVGPDMPVGVMLDRSAGMVAALLGVLKAGGAYLPIETDTPRARIAQLLSDGPAPVCLVSAAHASLVMAAGGHPLALPERDGPAAAPAVAVYPDNLAAVYYTSGSTGRPKGVACTHAGWVNRMCWMQQHHPLRPGETVLHKTTLTFDDAAVEIFWPLMAGARVAMLGPGLHRDPRAIADAAVRHRAVHVQFVPSMLDLFLETLTDADTAGLSELRSVLSSGEALRPALVRRFGDRFGDRVILDNTWGATEVSIDSTCRVCLSEDGAAGAAKSVSIGVPIDNNEVLVLDQRLEQLPVGVSGELFIAGAGLARGYVGDPRRTAEVFLPHPYLAGERIYRTGDWGRLGADGALTFLSRRDDQVKVRGVRVELGEVEHALRVHPSVADAAVIAWEAVPGDKRLAAYVVIRAGTTCSPRLLTEHARELLPGYAVPGSVLIVDALPRHANGKLDRRGLPAPEIRDEQGEPPVAPRTSAERIVTEIWASVLGVENLGVNDDFFAEGGHSLLATRAIGRMRQAFTTALPLTLMFECPTPARAAAMVEEILLAEIAELTDEQAHELLSQQ